MMIDKNRTRIIEFGAQGEIRYRPSMGVLKPWAHSVLLVCMLLVQAVLAKDGTPVPTAAPALPPCPLFPTSNDACRMFPGTDDLGDRFVARFQSTYIWLNHDSFHAAYTGPQSLAAHNESSWTLSGTAYLGLRLWKGGEFYADPEAFAAKPFSGLFGLAGIQNGELQKASGTEIRAYAARAFFRQTLDFGGGSTRVESGFNQLATTYDRRRLVFTVGKISLIDIFEHSSYANDPRTQFMNWALITYGAYDFAADARGYNIGAAAELYWDDWVLRAGRFMEPTIANGRSLHYNLFRFHGDQLELEHDHQLGDRPGIVRLLVFRNVANAGRYRDAIDLALSSGTTPDVTAVRHPSAKMGYGLSVEQTISPALALWARGMYADDQVEEYAFTEIDNSLSAGLSLKGAPWRRPSDVIGVAYSSDGLNRDHQNYFALGGLGGFLGDGRLTYAREQIAEAYYSALAYRNVHLTIDYQRVANPGYNRDRHGPVNIIGGRFHVEF
jgi:high affinity Mn2+ porin